LGERRPPDTGRERYKEKDKTGCKGGNSLKNRVTQPAPVVKTGKAQQMQRSRSERKEGREEGSR